MRVLAFSLVHSTAAAAESSPSSPAPVSAASPVPSPVPSSEPSVLGAWHFAERDVTVSLYRSAGGLLQGTITASPRPAEVGVWIIRDGRWSERERHYTGRLVTEETGVADAVIDLVTAADGAATLRLVCSRFWLTKTLTWTRPPTKKEAP